MKQLLSTITLLLFSVALGMAQQLPTTNQYIINTFVLNPAFAGENGNIEAFLGYRASWLGVDGAPRLSHVNLNASFAKTMGLGVSVQSESTGNFEHFHGSLAYAYHLQLGDDMYASLGLETMFYRNQIDNSNVRSQGLDPLLANSAALGGTTFDAGAGAGFWMKNLTFGVAAKRLIGPSIEYEGDEQLFFYKPDMHINGFLSYTIPIGQVGGKARSRKASKKPKYRVEPMAVVHYTAGGFFYDAAVNFMFRDRIWAGGLYRTDGSAGIQVGGALQERIIMSYSYEFGMGQSIASQSSGTHEISIGFLLKANEKKRGRTLFLLDPPLNQGGGDPKLEEKLNAVNDSLKNYVARTDPRIKKLEEDVRDLKNRLSVAKEDKKAQDYEAPFVIKNIKFTYNNWRLLPSSYPELKKLIMKMKRDPKLEILITGYTDNFGSKNFNMRLSKRRAKSVKDFFMKNGIAESRIAIDGKGPANPKASNATKEGRAKNRRIEGAFRRRK